jgi:hypothetical protein
MEGDLEPVFGLAGALGAQRDIDLVGDGHGDRYAVDRQGHGTAARDLPELVRNPNVEVVASRLGSEGTGHREGHV